MRAQPFSEPDGVIEQGVLNDADRISGRAQSAVRPLSVVDFNRVVDYRLEETDIPLPRVDGPPLDFKLPEEPMPLIYEQARDRVDYTGSRIVRDRVFRWIVLAAYDERCAITGIKLINGGGRAEVEAAHIRPVEADGPDIVSNGLALSGTAHWLFDRGLISLADDLEILVSR